jgi:hypothetical protein
LNQPIDQPICYGIILPLQKAAAKLDFTPRFIDWAAFPRGQK